MAAPERSRFAPRHGRRLVVTVVVVASASVAAAACSSPSKDEPTSCRPVPESLGPDCVPAYEPTYDNLFANTFTRSCAFSGVSCHASTGKQGGIDFQDPDQAYGALVGPSGSVTPGDPACSELTARITSDVGLYRMPPAGLLPVPERCAIVRWIAGGARR